MRVLVISQYFPPETGGPQNRLISLAQGFVDAGHEVHVITEKPNYPKGIVWEEYRGGFFKDETVSGIDVTYCWIWEDHKKRFLTRIRFYLSFVFSSIIASFRLKGKFDVVLASSPPLFVGISGWFASRIKRAKLIFDVRDLWPDVAIAMGELRNERAARMAKGLERFIYRKSAGITAVTDSFCEDIRQTVGGNKQIIRVTNGTVPENFRVDEEADAIRADLNLPSGFIATFAGNLGLAQGLDHLVHAAKSLETIPDAYILIVGDGAVKERLVELKQELGADRVIVKPRTDARGAARYMAASDALIVCLADNPIYEKFIPSKLFDSMAASKPVLLSVRGESHKIMTAASAGLFYPPEDPQGLADAILALRADKSRAESMGEAGRQFVAKNFSRRAQAALMVQFAERLVAPTVNVAAEFSVQAKS